MDCWVDRSVDCWIMQVVFVGFRMLLIGFRALVEFVCFVAGSARPLIVAAFCFCFGSFLLRPFTVCFYRKVSQRLAEGPHARRYCTVLCVILPQVPQNHFQGPYRRSCFHMCIHTEGPDKVPRRHRFYACCSTEGLPERTFLVVVSCRSVHMNFVFLNAHDIYSLCVYIRTIWPCDLYKLLSKSHCQMVWPFWLKFWVLDCFNCLGLWYMKKLTTGNHRKSKHLTGGNCMSMWDVLANPLWEITVT